MGSSLLEKARVGRLAALEKRRAPEAKALMPLSQPMLRLVCPISPDPHITNVFVDLEGDAPAGPTQRQMVGRRAVSQLGHRASGSTC